MSLNKSLFTALGVLAISSVMAYEQSFESGTPGNEFTGLSGWGGYGTYSNTAARTLAAGVPLTSANHAVHLAVDGWVTNTLEGTANSDAQLDMLVKVAKPDEALSGMSDTEAKFAMAIDDDGTLKYWDGDSWESLGLSAFEENDWIRVAVIYDNAGQRCKVSVDGNACVTEDGYKAATGSDKNGPWYPVLQTTTAISSLKVVGTTALDDVKVAYGSNSSYVPQYKDANGNDVVVDKGGVDVPLAWFDQNNVATNATTAPDSSGMTIADKYQTGMDPNGNEKFELKSMSMTKSGETVTATITVPACTPPSGSVKIQTTADKSGSWTDGATLDPGAESAQITLGSGNVTYFRMVLDKSSN